MLNGLLIGVGVAVMAIPFIGLPSRRLLTFIFIFTAPFISPILPSLLTVLCLVWSFTLSFVRSLLILFSMTCSVPLGLNVLFHCLGFLLRICRGSWLCFAVCRLNLSPLAPFGIFPARSSSFFLWPLLVAWVSSRLSHLPFPFRGMIFFFHIFPNSSLSPNRPLTLFRGLFVSVPCVILLGTYWA